MSSVTVPVATPPIDRSASVRTTALVPHQNAASQRFLAAAITR